MIKDLRHLPRPEQAIAPNLAGELGFSTPRRIAALGVTLVLATLVSAITATAFIHHAAAANHALAHDCEPSVVTAQKLGLSLADFDANLLNQLICQKESSEYRDAVSTATKRRREISEYLVAAAENITFGDHERIPIRTISENLGGYEALMAQSTTYLTVGKPDEARAAAASASRLMHQIILPAANDLDQANDSVLKQTYDSYTSSSNAYLACLIVPGAIILAALVVSQVLMRRWTRRLINPGLAAATVLALALLVHSTAEALRLNEALRYLVHDAYDSVYALWHTRAVAYDANGQETLWLFDRAHADQYQTDFEQLSKQILSLPDSLTCAAVAQTSRNGQLPPEAVTGFLAVELRNITFDGELDAATATTERYGVYLEIDHRIRALENQGQHAEAVHLCTSSESGMSNWAYANFDQALMQTIDINMKAFDHKAEWIHSECPTAVVAIWVLAGLIIIAAVGGLGLRVREYI